MLLPLMVVVAILIVIVIVTVNVMKSYYSDYLMQLAHDEKVLLEAYSSYLDHHHSFQYQCHHDSVEEGKKKMNEIDYDDFVVVAVAVVAFFLCSLVVDLIVIVIVVAVLLLLLLLPCFFLWMLLLSFVSMIPWMFYLIDSICLILHYHQVIEIVNVSENVNDCEIEDHEEGRTLEDHQSCHMDQDSHSWEVEEDENVEEVNQRIGENDPAMHYYCYFHSHLDRHHQRHADQGQSPEVDQIKNHANDQMVKYDQKEHYCYVDHCCWCSEVDHRYSLKMMVSCCYCCYHVYLSLDPYHA